MFLFILLVFNQSVLTIHKITLYCNQYPMIWSAAGMDLRYFLVREKSRYGEDTGCFRFTRWVNSVITNLAYVDILLGISNRNHPNLFLIEKDSDFLMHEVMLKGTARSCCC